MNSTNDSVQIQNFTLQDFLDYLGDSKYVDIFYLYAFPITGALGVVLSTLNVWIFLQKEFSQPCYDYYRVLTVNYLIELIFCIPYGLCYSPRYLPQLDSHACTLYEIFYVPLASFSFHYSGLIEIAIQLDRMKNFTPFLKKHNTMPPRMLCLILAVFCLLMNIFIGFVYVSVPLDWYYYENGQVRMGSIYFFVVSDLALSKIGSVVLITIYVLRDFVTLLVGVILNITCFVQMKRFLGQKYAMFKTPRTSSSDPNNKKQLASQSSEKKMSLMVCTLCLISILSRITTTTGNIYYFLAQFDFYAQLLAGLDDYAVVLNSTLSFFVFYHFNKKFRQEFIKVLRKFYTK